ncbi:MAG: protein kinase [Gammaproteobacteria bacterium]|jgi:serine/threonine protein kinase
MFYNKITIHFQKGLPKGQELKQLKQLFKDKEEQKRKQPTKKDELGKIKKGNYTQKKYYTHLANSIEKLPDNTVKALFKNEIKSNETIYTIIPNNNHQSDNLLVYRAYPQRKKIKKIIKKIENKINALDKKSKDRKLKKLEKKLKKLNEKFKKCPIQTKVVKLNVFFTKKKDKNGYVKLREINGKNIHIYRISRTGKEGDLKRWIKYTKKYNSNTVYSDSTKPTRYYNWQDKTSYYKGAIYQKNLQQNLDDYFGISKTLEKNYFATSKTLEKKLEIFLKIIAKLKIMHKNKDIHSDLKPANIMIDEYDKIHIIDFNITAEEGKPFHENRIENARNYNYLFFSLPILNGTEKNRSKQFDISSLGVTFWLILGVEREDYEGYKEILEQYRHKLKLNTKKQKKEIDKLITGQKEEIGKLITEQKKETDKLIDEQKKEINKLIKDSLSTKNIDKNIIKYIQKMIYIKPKDCPTLEKVEENFKSALQEEKQRKIIRTELNTCFNKIEKKVKTENNKNEVRIFIESCFNKIEKKVNNKNNKRNNIKKPKPITPKKQPVKPPKKPRKISVNTKPIGFNPQATFIAGPRAIKPNPNQIILCYAIAASIVTLSFGFYMITTFLNITRKIPNRKELSNNFNSIVKFLRHA